MKARKLSKRLVLNKKTISNLGYVQMAKSRGGADPTKPPLPSCNEFDETKCAICTEVPPPTNYFC